MERKTGILAGQALLAFVIGGAPGFSSNFLMAQEPNPTAKTQENPDSNEVTKQDGIYLYRVKVVQRDLDAVNYLHRSAATTIGFMGTTLLPMA